MAVVGSTISVDTPLHAVIANFMTEAVRPRGDKDARNAWKPKELAEKTGLHVRTVRNWPKNPDDGGKVPQDMRIVERVFLGAEIKDDDKHTVERRLILRTAAARAGASYAPTEELIKLLKSWSEDTNTRKYNFEDVDYQTQARFSLALTRSYKAITYLCDRLPPVTVSNNSQNDSANVFDRLLQEPLEIALAILASAYRKFTSHDESDTTAANAIKHAVRVFVELLFSEATIAQLRPQALSPGVFMDLPAHTITGAEIMEARFQKQPVKFIETTIRDRGGGVKPGRPRGAFAIPMPPTFGPDTLDNFGSAVESWLRDRFSYPGENLRIGDIRTRLRANIISQGRRYYFVVNAPEWGLTTQLPFNAECNKDIREKTEVIIRGLNRKIPEIAFFSLSKNMETNVNYETNVLQSVFGLLNEEGNMR